MPPTDLSAIEARLRLAARRYNESRHVALERQMATRELEGLLSRFDCALPVDADRAIGDRLAPFPEEVSDRLKRRCADALARLSRHARAADPRYDINRHMAIKRLARWLDGTAPWHVPADDRARPGKRRHRNPPPVSASPSRTIPEAARYKP